MKFPFFNPKRGEKKRVKKVFISSISKKNIVIPVKPISAIIIGFLIIACLYLLFRSDIFLLREILFEKEATAGNTVELMNEKTLEEESRIWDTFSLFTFPSRSEEKRLLGKYPSLLKLEIRKQFPRGVKVYYQERKQAAVVKAKNGEFVLDSSGLIFAQNQSGITAPLFEDLEKEWQIKDKMNSQKITFALQVVSQFENLELRPVNFVFLGENDLSVKTDSSEIVFSSLKEIDLQIMTLQTIYKNAKIEGRTYKKIDLRFDRPVIVE